jgi:hypothetical protein
MMQLKLLEKQQAEAKINRKKDIIKVRVEINEMKIKRTIQRINGMSCFFEKLDNIDKPLPKLTKRKKEKIQINKVRNEEKGILQQVPLKSIG